MLDLVCRFQNAAGAATLPPSRPRRVAAVSVAALAMAVASMAMPPRAAAQAPAEAPGTGDATTAGEASLGEVEVVGERPGPGLWRVSKGSHTLYVLGTLRPLPKKMEWRSREVEDVVARAQVVIPENTEVDADVGVFRAIKLYSMWRKLRKNPGGATLDTVLPPELYARFETLRTKYAPRDRDLAELRPVIAVSELWRSALDSHRLVNRVGIDARVRKLAKAAKVKVEESTVNIGDPTAALQELGRVPLDAEIRCMAAALDGLESGIADARTLADAWATGDVDLIRERAPWARQAPCWDALATAPAVHDIQRRVEAAWFDAAVGALEKHETSFAVTSLADLLRAGGMLERLRAKGYEIVEP